MATVPQQRYNVGGILLPRPFKVRRLGHFGFNAVQLTECLEFYNAMLGFKISDMLDFAAVPGMPEHVKTLGDTRGYFMRHGTDHHAFVLFNKRVMECRPDRAFQPEVTINQITWQVGSLKEVVDAFHYFQEQQVPIQRVGRDMPGSNWHCYVYDPDGHTNEFYYGIEQVGWNDLSKPQALYYRRFREEPQLPQMSETTEVAQARHEKGIDIFSGHHYEEALPARYDVEGVLLPRPFKITKIGPVHLFVDDVDAAEQFYTDMVGFVKTEDSLYHGARCVFLRAGTEHHSLALFPKELRETLGLSPHTTCKSFGVEMGSYQQLREAVAFLKAQGVTIRDLPPELAPGIDYTTYALDPDGHCIQLYYYMEQVGWDGRPRPQSQRRQVNGAWPATLEPLSDTYVDQVFQGPLG
jgi:catechol 2,3-dioxygenase-like lactoylglutathione lyase family enzyme